jgi:hypothetical protein
VIGRVCTKWVGLHVISGDIKMYSYLLVAKTFYPLEVSLMPDKIKRLYR